jgi:ribosomal protein S18 acetylase RimI-like enzyme
MRFMRRSFSGAADIQRMHALAVAFPHETRHVADLPYKLSSPPLHDDPGHDVALWEDEGGALVGFGLIQNRGWLDLAIDRAARSHGIESEIVEWAVERFRQNALGRTERLPYWVSAREDDADRIAVFERHGFARGKESVLRLHRPLDVPIDAPEVPEGFVLRPLAGEAEVEAYVAVHRAAFGTQNMTVEWRRRTLTAPAYRQELDLVVEAPNGRLAAFTILWLNPSAQGQSGRRDGQIEPAGTHPDFQRRGLARALLLEGFRRLAAAGAEIALVETDTFRGPAQRLYESVGFTLHRRIARYFREF